MMQCSRSRCALLIYSLVFLISFFGTAEATDPVKKDCPMKSKQPLHYRPAEGRLADTIPFFWKGDYHIFYLRGNIGKVPWEHLVSKDLITWKELPTALVSDGDPDGPDGEHMFTGSVTERDGTFHIFYTGWNPRNKAGREWVMHATSSDLIHWTKHPEHKFRADEVHYQNTDFRDPYVFWNPADESFWMILCARDAKTGQPVQGKARSKDLLHWNQEPPLALDPPLGEGTPECPDLFQIGDTWHLLNSPCAGVTDMRYSSDINGPFKLPKTPSIDTPILYAAKRMFDGERHIITGWLRDLGGGKDSGDFRWGGTQSLPREVYAGPQGQLFFRPIPAAIELFTQTCVDLNSPTSSAEGVEKKDNEVLLSTKSRLSYHVPDDFFLEALVHPEGNAQVQLCFRVQEDPKAGYCLTLKPSENQVSLSSPAFNYERAIYPESWKEIRVQAFLEGSILECFINDAYAFSCRCYDYTAGDFAIGAENGSAKVSQLQIRTQGD